jgi:exonuclease III
MRIVTWNCNGAFRKKYHLFDKFEADVIVIQECERPHSIKINFGDWSENFLWVGENKNKGLGVFSKLRTQLIDLQWKKNGLKLFIPCQIDEKIIMVAVWTKNPKGSKSPYIGQLSEYLNINEFNIKGREFVICGDFNSNSKWDQIDRNWNHSNVVDHIFNMGLISLYHTIRNEKQGFEKDNTFYMQRNINKPYHIDYAFISSSLYKESCKFEIGLREEWLQHSDHMPVIFEF